MGQKHKRQRIPAVVVRGTEPKTTPSLLDAMVDGKEYGSIVSLVPSNGDLVPELRRALAEIESIRGRPCICYLANVVKDGLHTSTAIATLDHLPFSEMVAQVPSEAREVDVLLVTPGGSAEQVTQFVDCLRARFDTVEFLIPYMAMSAGTLWALSGDKIWMDERAFLGPVDPQVPTREGRFVPAQALLALLDTIKSEGAAALGRGEQPPWTYIVLLKELDQKQIGYALSATKYVITMAAQYLEKYKFRTWTAHSSTGAMVTPAERRGRALESAAALCSHDRWKAHGHAITREDLERELRIKIDRPESVAGLQRAMRRLWALAYYVFDKGTSAKVILSQNYAIIRHDVTVIPQPK